MTEAGDRFILSWPQDARVRYAWAFKAEDVLKRSEHGISKGGRQPWYIDFDFLVRDPIHCRQVVELMVERIQRRASGGLDYIAFLEKRANTTGAIVLAGALSMETGIPHLVIRLAKDVGFEKVKMPGKAGNLPLQGDRVLLVSDYVTKGRELLAAIRVIKMAGGEVVGVLAYVMNRDEFDQRREHWEAEVPWESVEHVYTAQEAIEAAELAVTAG